MKKWDSWNLMKIQYGSVYIEFPMKDLESVTLVKDVLNWYLNQLKEKLEAQKDE